MAETYIIPTIDDYTKQQYLDKVTADLKAAIASFEIQSKSITSDLLADGAVTSTIIAEASITSAHIQDGAIGNLQVGTAAIQSANIGNAVIDSIHVKSGAIQAIHIMDATIDNTKIALATIQGANIAQATIDGLNVKQATIDGANLKSATIDGANIKTATISEANIAQGTLTSASIQAGSIGQASIAQAAIGTAQIQDLAVTSAKVSELIADKIISGTLNTGRVTISGVGGHLSLNGNRLQVFDNSPTPIERVSIGDVNNDGSIFGFRVRGADGTTVLYDERGVYNQGITDGAITNPKIQDDSIDSRVLMVDAVIAENIKSGAVTADKILANTITGTHIAGNTITANNLVTGTITATSGVIANGAITTAMIGTAQITNALIADATIDKAKIASVDAAKITAGTINADLVTISNGKVTINSTGVTVKDANFLVQDSISGYKYALIPGTNQLVDHSFEMLTIGSSVANGFYNVGNGSQDVWYRWATAGSPILYSSSEGDSYAPYGRQAIVVNSSNSVSQAFHVTPGQPYTLSFTNKYPAYGTAGNPRGAIQWWYSDGMDDYMFSQSYIDFSVPTNNGSEVRNVVTATCPTNMPAGMTYYGIVNLNTGNANWAMFDGVQLVQGSNAAPYNPEDEVWRMRRGTDKYSNVYGNISVDSITMNGDINGGTIYMSNWFRSTGSTGWYNQTYSGGWYMTDTTWIRAYNSKSVYTPGNIQADGDFLWQGIKLIEKGSNGNGAYMKFSNGTMIAWMQSTVTNQGISSAYGSLYQGTRTWTFPVAFTGVPSVSVGQFKYDTGASWGAVSGASTTTNTTLRGLDAFSRAASASVYVQIDVMAIGTWR